MQLKLVTAIAELTSAHRASITDTCARYGITPIFFETESEALTASSDADILFTSSAALTRSAARLKWVCTPSAGINQFTAEGVFSSPDAVLTNSSGAYGTTISEHVIMMLLEILRRQPEYNSIVENRQWIRNLPIRSIYGARVTLLGTGDIGTKIAARLEGFSPARVTGVNRSGRVPSPLYQSVLKIAELDSILPETDILICSLPGTPETEHILNAERLSMLPDGAVIINVGRGSLIDQRALEAQLRAGRIFAGLDVFEKEPIPADDSMWTCPNLLITPHSAGNMSLAHTVDVIVEMFLEDLVNFAEGKPLKHSASIKAGY